MTQAFFRSCASQDAEARRIIAKISVISREGTTFGSRASSAIITPNSSLNCDLVKNTAARAYSQISDQ